MPLFPRVASPCPYVNRLSEIIDGDVCRMCKREVFDLTAMTDGERLAFVAGCKEEVCVSYSVPIGPMLRTAAIAAAIASPSVAAARPAPRAAPVAIPVAGGLAPPPQVRMIEIPPVVERAEDLPPVYEDEPAAETRDMQSSKQPLKR